MDYKLLHGDCLDKLKELEDNSIDAVVTDPPYGLSFMGKKWDYDVPKQEVWEECMRVLKPGGHLLAFAGSRTYHRMAVRVEDAGFEIRDQIMWLYGSGFPKSHNIGKAVDKLEGNQRQFVGLGASQPAKSGHFAGSTADNINYTEDKSRYNPPVTKGNSEWEGWGTALKPAHEPIVMARKPFKGSVAQNVLEHGVGGLNIDGCRVEYEDTQNPATNPKYRLEGGYKTPEKGQESKGAVTFSSSNNDINPSGRFPANIILDEEAGKILDQQSGILKSGYVADHHKTKDSSWFGASGQYSKNSTQINDLVGGASRFFYCPKVSKKERNEGMESKVPVFTGRPRREDGSVIYKETHPEEWAEAMKDKPRKDKTSLAAAEEKLQRVSQIYAANQTSSKIGANPSKPTQPRANIHPTVKPTDLMAYLIRLVTPKNGVVLDPFMGSGSTGKACAREGMRFVGIEMDEEYMEIAKQRVEHEYDKRKFF